MNPGINLSLLVISLTIYGIRLIPFLFFRKPIKNKYFRSFLYYVPYVTLAVMTFPSILSATGSYVTGTATLVVGLVAAYLFEDLFSVAISCCVVALAFGIFF